MNNGKVRIYELSKELELENKDILAICDKLDIAVKSHSSTISEEEATKIKSVATADGYKPARKAVRPKSKTSRSPAKPSAPKPARPRQQQILEIRRYPKPAQPPEADRSAAADTSNPNAPSPAAPSRPSTQNAPSLASPPPRPSRPGAPRSPQSPVSRPTSAAGAAPVAPPREPVQPPSAPEKIVSTSGASPDQLRPRLVAPPSRLATGNKPAPGRGRDNEVSRVAKPVLKRDRTSDHDRPSRPSPGSADGGGSAPPMPRKSVVELKRPVSRKTAVDSSDDADDADNDDDGSFVDPTLDLRRPTPPRPPKRRDRSSGEEDDEQEMRPKKTTKTKRQRVIVDDDDELDDIESSSADVTPAQITMSLMRPPKPKGQRQSKPAPTT